MMDQASFLRTMSNRQGEFFQQAASTRILAVTSGKGGVGKTNVALNLAIALSHENRRVGLLDADFGLANVDVLLGLAPRNHLAHLIFGDATLDDIVLEGPGGVAIVPASSGLERMANLSGSEKNMLWAKLHPLLARLDLLMIDTAAGISSTVMDFLVRAEMILLVCSEEPTSLVDAYALVKVLEKRSPGKRILVVVNSVESEERALEVFNQLNQVIGRFLKREAEFLGWVVFDEAVTQAVRKQKAVMDWKPMAPASRSYVRLARKLLQQFSGGEDAAGAPAQVFEKS